MGRLYFMPDGDEMVRRRARVPKGSVVEAWADRRGGGAFWVGEESKRLLDEAGAAPMPPPLAAPGPTPPGLHGPRICDRVDPSDRGTVYTLMLHHDCRR